MLTLIGVLTLATVILLLLFGRVSPVVALASVPVAGALLAGFDLTQISEFFESGLGRVMSVAAMFIFAITFFGVLQDTGLFRPLIDGLVRLTRGNPVYVALGTALAGMLAHLDGAGATTFLLTVPALLPLYRRLGMNPYVMLLLLASGAGILNMMPWAGPLGRAAAVTGLDVTELWHPLIPVQIAGAVILMGMAFLYGRREQRRIASGRAYAYDADTAEPPAATDAEDPARALERPRLIWVNAAIFFATLVMLVSGVLPTPLTFMLALSVALVVNYPDAGEQMRRIQAHASAALTMAAIILAAGVFLGVMDGTGMLRAIAQALVAVLPSQVVPVLHILLGIIGLPLELVLSTDAHYFGLLPIVAEIVGQHGVPPQQTVYAMMVANIVGTFISPFSPALWLALGLAGLDMGRHIRFALLPMWAYSLAIFAVAWMMGLF
ncbi:CitMHS family transporter [Falsirhodobacter halotolerans]|uniref:CitMHS family transporter n=1 Tax=Falsirhodobacter halotolerans TaxID=1146892 RepID=UPI001FD45416|nr:citrate:proton symporter [Falsirhodobacter halotolerans]MCJ8140622.1 citrate:proton symporter [Falsirhodobacter halotolerans]